MIPLFAVSVVVQYNDPDPLYWMAIYGVSLALAIQSALGKTPLVPNAAALAVYTALAARSLPDLLGGREEAFTHWHMLSAGDEVAREAGGLLICAVWAAIQTLCAWRWRAHA
jgi:hypothetical protein